MPDEPTQPSEQFARDLRAIYHADVRVPARIDDAVLTRARAHFARRGSRGLVLRIGALITAAAAVVVVAIYLAKPQAPDASQVAVAPGAPSDVKTKEGVDIVTALRVARHIRDGRADQSRDDFNHDGAVDQRDVDAIAMAAVRLETKVQ
jgi:hypothetical protein